MSETKKHHFLYYIFLFDRKQCKIENENILKRSIRNIIYRFKKGE